MNEIQEQQTQPSNIESNIPVSEKSVNIAEGAITVAREVIKGTTFIAAHIIHESLPKEAQAILPSPLERYRRETKAIQTGELPHPAKHTSRFLYPPVPSDIRKQETTRLKRLTSVRSELKSLDVQSRSQLITRLSAMKSIP